MKKQIHSFVLILLIFSLGCNKEQNWSQDDPQLTSNAKPTGLQQIPLIVELQPVYNDREGLSTTSKINSDNGQIYIHGVDYVQAIIDQNGNFAFSTNNSKNSPAKRFVVYDLSDPADGNTDSPGFGRGLYYQYNYLFSTSGSTFGTAPVKPLQDLLVGESECLSLTGNVNGDRVNSVFKYTVRFHATKDDLSDSPTAFAIVKRLSENQWQIIPGLCSSTTTNNVGAVWTGDPRNEVWKGNYHLPFSFLLTSK